MAPECEHLFCRECLLSWFARSPEGQLPFTCPQCRSPVAGIKSVDEARTKLKKAHRIICNKVDALLVLCPVCFARNERQHQRAHELRCPVDCEQGCQAKVAPADREAHLAVCEGTIVPCEAADAGCSWSGRRKELTAHTGSCPTVPMRGILVRLIALEKENARLKQLEEKLETLSDYVSPPTETCKKCKATRTWRLGSSSVSSATCDAPHDWKSEPGLGCSQCGAKTHVGPFFPVPVFGQRCQRCNITSGTCRRCRENLPTSCPTGE